MEERALTNKHSYSMCCVGIYLHGFEVFTINTLYYITFYVHNNQFVAKMILHFYEITFLDGPILATGQTVRVFEGQSVRLSTSVSSNPASNISWFKDNVLLLIQPQVNGTTSYTIAKTECIDIGPFQVVTSNGVQSNHSTTVSLYVYCCILYLVLFFQSLTHSDTRNPMNFYTSLSYIIRPIFEKIRC